MLPVHHRGAEAIASELTRVAVDTLRTFQEFLAVGKESSIVVQIVDVHFEPASTELRGGLPPSRILTFRDQLKGRLDAVLVVEVDELATTI